MYAPWDSRAEARAAGGSAAPLGGEERVCYVLNRLRQTDHLLPRCMVDDAAPEQCWELAFLSHRFSSFRDQVAKPWAGEADCRQCKAIGVVRVGIRACDKVTNRT